MISTTTASPSDNGLSSVQTWLHTKTGVWFELEGGRDAPGSKKEGLIQVPLAVTDKQFLGLLAGEIHRTRDLTMAENDGIDPIPAAHTVPIDQPDFEHFLRNHQSTATMAAVDQPPPASGNG
jgi:hypothetical protein